MNSETSTDARAQAPVDPGLQPRHFFVLMSMAGATVAVMVAGKGHPVALVMLSLTVMAAGLVGLAVHGALAAFFGRQAPAAPAPRTVRETAVLERDKLLVMRSIKELEFDRAMGKVSEEDFARIDSRLRAKAIALMQALDRAQAAAPPPAAASAPAPASEEPLRACAGCGTSNDADARFCKACGGRL
jgi:hypothetical protein